MTFSSFCKICALLLIFGRQTALAQTHDAATSSARGAYLRYSADFYSNKYPGFQAGLQTAFWEKAKTKTRRNGIEKIRIHSRLWEIQMGFNRHRQEANSVVYLSSNLIFKKMRPNGFFREHVVGMGIQRNILDGRGWDVKADGSVEEVKNHGYWSALPQYAFSLGWDFRKTRLQLPVSIVANTSLHVQFPYNGNFLPRPKLNLGFNYHFHSKK